jgi:hypothetical protein
MRGSGPRAHHFAPQCWLAGFTDTCQQSGRLWVTDLEKRKQWRSNPRKAGHRRDFYRVSDPRLDPFAFEKAFSLIETLIAPILKNLCQTPREPTAEELRYLLYFAAFEYIRVPAFRPVVLKIADSLHRSWMSKALASQASWARMLKKAGISVDTPGAAYDEMLAFERDVIKAGEYSLSAENEWYLSRGFQAAATAIFPSLAARSWGAMVSESGSFIGSDNPVMMDGPKDAMIGFKSADVVFVLVNRHLLLYGTRARVRPPPVSRKLIARHNTFAMLTAEEQLFSHVPDFCWLDEVSNYQTDWKLFCKEKLVASIGMVPS